MNFNYIYKRFLISSLTPFTLFIICVLLFWAKTFKDYQKASTLEQNIQIVHHISQLVTELQRERGASAGFVNGGFPLEKLHQQIQQTDIALKKYHQINSDLPTEIKERYNKQVTQLTTIRNRIAKKTISTKEVVTYFSTTIKLLLSRYIDLTNIHLLDIPLQLKSVRILEEAKENSGKLRAVVTGILSKNSAITKKKLDKVLQLKAGVSSNLSSYGLTISPTGKKLITQFQNSKNWRIVLDTIQLIVGQYSTGQYNRPASKFFDTITISVNDIGKIVKDARDNLLNHIQQIQSSAKNLLILLTIGLIILVTGLAVLLKKMLQQVTMTIQQHSDQLINQKQQLQTSINKIVNNLNNNYKYIAESMQQLQDSSKQLAQTSEQQSAAVEESTASMEEISSMLDQTNKSGQEASNLANQSQVKTTEGENIINSLSNSINDIHNNNKDLNKIIELINAITEKTKIINNIVVKTELLSFNASIEAARAAEYGKGFAVVAEEIGNLARLSGSSAKDIESLLEQSSLQINEIIEQVQAKVTTGQKITQQCVEVFKDIKSLNSNVTMSVSSIAAASNEQFKGVEQTTLAMTDISKGTQSTLKVIQNTSSLAQQVNQEINTLKQSIISLQEILANT